MNRKKERAINNFIMVAVPVGILLLWEIAGRMEWINTAIMSTPSIIGKNFINLWAKGTIQKNLAVSSRRVLVGFCYGTAAGIVLGILMGQFEKVNKAFAVIVGVLRPIPMIGWTPLFILWMGLGESSKITIIAISAFWSVLVNTIDGIQSVDKRYLEVASMLEKGKFDNIIHIVLPTIAPNIFTGLRLGVSNAWRGVVAAEMIAATAGIGYMISFAREMAQPATLLLGLLIIGLICLVIDSVILWLQKIIFKWNR